MNIYGFKIKEPYAFQEEAPGPEPSGRAAW